MKEYPHSSFIPSRGNDTRTPLSHGLRANLEPSAKHVIIKRNQCKGGISLLKKILMTMALCAASAMPLVSEAKNNAGAQLPAQAEATQGKAEDTLKRPAFEDKRIEINLASRLLTLYQGGRRHPHVSCRAGQAGFSDTDRAAQGGRYGDQSDLGRSG